MTVRTSNGLPFVVLAPEPAVRTGIEVRVYDGTSPNTLLDVVARSRGREWLDQLNDVGSGKFLVHERDPVLEATPNLLEYGNIVRFRLDGVDRFAFRIEHLSRPTVPGDEEAGRWIEVSGRGVLSLLEDAIIYLSSGLTGDTERPFTNVTPGEVMKTLVTEAQARGALDGVTLTFDENDDSENAPFDDVLDLSERAGSDLLQVASRHAELAVDVSMTPALVLEYFNERGVDRSFQTVNAPPAMLRPAHEVSEQAIESEGVIKNVLLIEGPSTWSERQHGGSVTAYGRREAYLQLGNTTSAAQITQAADAALRDHANPADSITLRVEDRDGNRPYVDWGVGDYVLAPGIDGSLTRYRVRGIAVSEDDEGVPVFVPELSTVAKELEERYQRWLKRMSPGTIGGTAADIASPALDPATATTVAAQIDQHAATAKHADELGDLDDVDTAGVAAGKLLRYDGSLWVVSDPSAHGSHAGGWSPLLDSKPGPADTPDDDFSAATLDPKWTAVSGTLGVVSLMFNGARSRYDLTTRPGMLLVQVGGSGQSVRLRQDYTLPTAKSIVAAMHLAPIAAGDNQRCLLVLNTDDSDWGAGEFIAIGLEQDATGLSAHSIQAWSDDNGTGTTMPADPFGGALFLRLVRAGSDVIAFYSQGGGSWVPLHGTTFTTPASNVWLAFAGQTVDGHWRTPVHAVDWVRQGTDGVDPW